MQTYESCEIENKPCYDALLLWLFMFHFHRRYFIIAVVLFIVEIVIALFVHDAFIRPYLGDFLVVIFLYSLLRSFINARVFLVALVVLLFSFIIETLQYFHFISWLGLEHSLLARLILGTSFAWNDLLAYTAGTFAIIVVEKVMEKRRKKKNSSVYK